MSSAAIPSSTSRDPDGLEPGLYIVATPIGNRADLSERARHVLAAADVLACEDTRVSQKLFESRPVGQQWIAYHDNNESTAAEDLADRIENGESVAVISDAGTPGISDPGFRIVRECHRRGLPVSPIPGPSALVAALSASGLPSDGFLFVGFLPPKSAARRTFLTKYLEFEYTLALYESTHRIGKFLSEITDVCGPDRVITVARELTKKFESIHTGKVAEVTAQVLAGSTKGEFVVLIAKKDYAL